MSWTLKDLLLHGAPWEVLPDDRPKVLAAARRWAKDPRLSARERAYIERVWLPREDPDPEPEPLPFTFPDSPGGNAP